MKLYHVFAIALVLQVLTCVYEVLVMHNMLFACIWGIISVLTAFATYVSHKRYKNG